MKRFTNIFILLSLFLFMVPVLTQAQNADSLKVPNNQIVELKTAEIKIKLETPQVNLLHLRDKPKFDDVHLDKSFKKEIAGSGEKFILNALAEPKENEKVDINELLNRKR